MSINSTCEIACFDDQELSLKGWQEARLTTLDQACNIEPISQVKIFTSEVQTITIMRVLQAPIPLDAKCQPHHE